MHDYLIEEHSHDHEVQSCQFGFLKTKGWISEVILDFQHVVLNAQDMEIPDADLYMGHSAGSIIALAKAKKKHCVLFGSPVKLIQSNEHEKGSFLNNCNCPKTKILNVLHKNDILGFPIENKNCENYIFRSPYYSLCSYNPISAHGSYWKSNKVVEKVAKTMSEWGF
jgi:hypothetical protein